MLLHLTNCRACSFQEKKRNNIKDFLNVAGPMGVTHFLILSKTQTAPYLRVARTPQGPTLTFKINEYSLAVDVARSQLRPRCPQDLFKNPPLVIFCFCTNTCKHICSSCSLARTQERTKYFLSHYYCYLLLFLYMFGDCSFSLQIVLSGFGSGEQHLKLTTIMFQNIFPAIDINTVSFWNLQDKKY